MAIREHAYKVSLICECQTDVAFGCGPTAKAARERAEFEFRDHHGTRTKYVQVFTEKLVAHDGGSHYEEESIALHFELPGGIGEFIYGSFVHRAAKRGERSVPMALAPGKVKRYVYESTGADDHRYLLDRLDDARKLSNKAMAKAASDRYDFAYRVVKYISPESLPNLGPCNPKEGK